MSGSGGWAWREDTGDTWQIAKGQMTNGQRTKAKPDSPQRHRRAQEMDGSGDARVAWGEDRGEGGAAGADGLAGPEDVQLAEHQVGGVVAFEELDDAGEIGR